MLVIPVSIEFRTNLLQIILREERQVLLLIKQKQEESPVAIVYNITNFVISR